MSGKIVKIINRYFSGNWLLSLASGILLIIAGRVITVMPQESYLIMTVIFGVFSLIAGIVGIIFVMNAGKCLSRIWLYWLNFILYLAVGIILIIAPGMSVMLPPLLISFWLIYKSFFVMDAWGPVAGTLSTLLAVSVLIKPAVVIMAVIYLTAFLSVCAGVFCIVFSIRLRRIKLKKVNE
jgi:uncharacterized membrane protein HdeD (DUF308 family)